MMRLLILGKGTFFFKDFFADTLSESMVLFENYVNLEIDKIELQSEEKGDDKRVVANKIDFLKSLEVVGSYPVLEGVKSREVVKIKNLLTATLFGGVTWNDPDPIIGNDYTVKKLHVNEDLETAYIHYGNGSEAEVYLHELTTDKQLMPVSVELSYL